MSNTSNLDLERPDKGAPDWHTSLNSNMTKLDTGYGNNVATVADLPQMYIETGTFNSTTGDTITLPVEVDATNEYSVEITPTSRAGIIGDIWVTKTTTNFVVKCVEANTTDTFEAVIYYLGDIASYGGSIYRRWYVSTDAGIVDHGDDTDTGSFAWVLDQIGATPSTIELPGNKTYTITTATAVPDNVNIIPQKGAVFDGAGTLTFDNYAQIQVADNQTIFGSSITIVFTNPPTVHPEWWVENATPGTTDMSPAIDSAIASFPNKGGKIKLLNDTYRFNTSIVYPVVSGEIRGIEIEGEGSSLGAGGATNPYGTRIDSYIAGGNVFDLTTSDAISINVRFRNFTVYDREGTGANYGIEATMITSGCVFENIGFKAFTTAIWIKTFAYYAKIDNVKSYYHRGWGFIIEGANSALLTRITASNGSSSSHGGMSLTSTTTPMRGAVVQGSYFEGNSGYGLSITTANGYFAGAVNILGNYFEGNGSVDHKPDIDISGFDATYIVNSGVINGNIFEQGVGAADHVSISLGYAKNIDIKGNYLNCYYNGRTIYSSVCSQCNIGPNFHHASAEVDVPENNTVLDSQSNLGARIRTKDYIETITADAQTVTPYGVTRLDSTSNKVDCTLGSAERIGTIKTIVMIEASNSSIVVITNHATEDAEQATFNAVDETGVFMWTGTEWVTIYATCTFL